MTKQIQNLFKELFNIKNSIKCVTSTNKNFLKILERNYLNMTKQYQNPTVDVMFMPRSQKAGTSCHSTLTIGKAE